MDEQKDKTLNANQETKPKAAVKRKRAVTKKTTDSAAAPAGEKTAPARKKAAPRKRKAASNTPPKAAAQAATTRQKTRSAASSASSASNAAPPKVAKPSRTSDTELADNQSHQAVTGINTEENITLADGLEIETNYLQNVTEMLRDQAKRTFDKVENISHLKDMADYLEHLPYRFHFPKVQVLLDRLSEKDEEFVAISEQIKAEHKSLKAHAKSIRKILESAVENPSQIDTELLRQELDFYLASVRQQLENREKMVINRSRQLFNEKDWKDVWVQASNSLEQGLSLQDVEAKYHEYSARIIRQASHAQDQLEEAAEELTLAEYFSMGAMFESIEPVVEGATKISRIARVHAGIAFDNQLECYKRLFFSRVEHRSQYISEPLDSLLRSYDTWVDGLVKIGEVLHGTKDQVFEPFRSRIELFKEIEHDSDK